MSNYYKANEESLAVMCCVAGLVFHVLLKPSSQLSFSYQDAADRCEFDLLVVSRLCCLCIQGEHIFHFPFQG
jgi:hypothetical protein